MTVQVHTYSNPKLWEEHPLFKDFQNSIHLCATANMKKGIEERYGEKLNYILTIREFMVKYFNQWYSQETQFQQYLKLSKLINDIDIRNNELKNAFRLNTFQILESIRSLVETKVEPNHLPEKLTDKEKLFKELWIKIEKIDNSYDSHRKELEKNLNLIQLENALRKFDFNLNFKSFGELTFVLHGFYFITPEQQCFLEHLRNGGVNIIFFNYYDNRYPQTFNFTKAFINSHFGWTDKWNIFENTTPFTSELGEKFLDAFENKKIKPDYLESKIICYPTFFDFLQNIILPNIKIEKEDDRRVIRKKANIIATNADILNEMLVTYYPELNLSNRNFLTYPVGRFLIKLHEIYNNGRFILNEEILMAIFSSGWLHDQFTNENAQNYTYDLQQIFPYFNGCEEINEWLERLENLMNQKVIIEKAFDTDSSNRILKSIQSPFCKLSYFSITLERLKQIKEFLNGIKLIVDDLFNQATVANSINEHFNRLNEIIKIQKNKSMTVLNSTELRIVNSLQEKLQNINDSSEFLYDDLQPALYFYLSGKFDKNPDRIITSFIEVDGESFKSQNHEIYLTGLDEQGLPLDTFDLPWPLQNETFEFLSKENKVLELFILRNKSTKQISRYLFFISLNLQSKELSWIENFLDRKNLQRALYVKLLKMVIEPFSSTKNLEELGESPFDFSPIKIEKEKEEEGWKSLSFEDFFAEYKLCPKRFYYGYILEEYPVFERDFMHQFIFSEIVKFTGQSTKADFENLLNEISPIFPQWLDYKKYLMAKESYMYIPKHSGKTTKVDDKHSYTETRRYFQFPGLTKKKRELLFKETLNSINEIQEELLVKENSKLEASPGYDCRFCPHIEYCSDAIFPIDLKKEKLNYEY